MVRNKTNSDTSQLHWFWRLTTKWWTFLIFYLVISILYLLISWQLNQPHDDFLSALVLSAIVLLPIGLGFYYKYPLWYFTREPRPGIDTVLLVFIILFFLFTISSILTIIYYKKKKNQILKGLIILLYLMPILALLGSILGSIFRIPGTPL